MKKVLLYSAFALGTLTMSTGCGDNFLMLSPVSSTSEQTLSDATGVDYLLTGAYSSLNSMLSSAGGMGEASLTNWVWGDIAGGDANKGSTASDQPDLTQIETWNWSTANSYIKNRWDAVYESVKRCNAVISLANKLGEALPNGAEVIAQAQFLKGFWMYEAIRIYGPAIPYVSVEDYEASTDPQVSNVDESGNYVYIWDKVAQDLIDAANVLPETWPDGQQGRATKWQAKAVLAKLYMNWSSPYDGSAGYGTGNKWTEVAGILDDIIANGKDAKGTKYQLADTYDALWNYETSDWTGESVFDVQFTFNGTTSQTASPHHTHATEFSGALGYGGWGFYQPSYEFVNSHIVDANGLPLSFAEYTAHKPLTPVGSAKTDLSVFTDPRIDVNVGRFGVPYLDWLIPYNVSAFIRDYGNGGMYFNKKGHSWKAERAGAATTHPTSTAINYHIIRFAEILLMRAECYYQEGNYAKVIEIVNQIRERAGKSFVAYQEPSNDDEAALVYKGVMENKIDGTTTEGAAANYRIGAYPASYANAAQAREALEREYRLEFGMEGHRWFDIARWGKVADVLNSFAKAESQYLGKYVNTYSSSWVNFPIPQAEVQTAMGRLVQTAAWK